MPTETPNPKLPPVPVEEPLSLRELATLLVKHYDLHEGLYDVLVEFRIGVGSTAGPDMIPLPGASVGVGRIGLAKAKTSSANTVDAAIVNPLDAKIESV